MDLNTYTFSTVDVWLLNVIEEGYQLDDDRKVPDEWVEEIVVWEGMWYLVPACKVRITDFGMNYLSYRHLGNVVIRMGLKEGSEVMMFDMAVAMNSDSTLEHTTRPTSVSMNILGYATPGLWLLQKGFKGYGYKSATEVADKFIEDVVLKNYGKYCDDNLWTWEYIYDESFDKKYYLQSGRSGFSFLGYLRDCAKSKSGNQDYFLWLSMVKDKEDEYIQWKLHFRSFEEMKKQDFQYYFEYVVDPAKWEKIWDDYGYMTYQEEGSEEKKVIPFMWYGLINKNQTRDTAKARFVKYDYDLNDLKVKKTVVDIAPELVGGEKSVKSNILASALVKDKDMLTEVVTVGSIDAPTRTVPDVGLMQKCRMLRKWAVAIPGVEEVEVGDKVRVIFPSGFNEVTESLSGDWIVGEIVHLYSFPGQNYMKKVVLVSDRWKSESKDA